MFYGIFNVFTQKKNKTKDQIAPGDQFLLDVCLCFFKAFGITLYAIHLSEYQCLKRKMIVKVIAVVKSYHHFLFLAHFFCHHWANHLNDFALLCSNTVEYK